MRTIVATLFTTLDGVVEAPHEWHVRYFDEAMGALLEDAMARQQGYLLGRTLYDEWSRYWPAHTGGDPFGAFIDPLPKWVLTHRPVEDPWTNTTVLDGDDAVAQVQALKAGGDGELGMSGCATTVRWLMAHGLLDELHLFLDPVVVGHGQRLFESDTAVPLTLLSSTALPKGALHLRYAPA